MNVNPTIDDKQMMGVEKSVRFEENVHVDPLFRPIEHQRDMTAEHRDQLWYNDDDFERIKSDIRNDVKTARRMRRTQSREQSESVCTLGIEHLLSANTLRSRIESKHAVVDAVLNEQERLRRSRMMDRPPVDTVAIPSFITIAQASMVASLRHRQNAVDRAN